MRHPSRYRHGHCIIALVFVVVVFVELVRSGFAVSYKFWFPEYPKKEGFTIVSKLQN